MATQGEENVTCWGRAYPNPVNAEKANRALLCPEHLMKRERKRVKYESQEVTQGEKVSPDARKHSQEVDKACSVGQLKENHPPPQEANKAETGIS